MIRVISENDESKKYGILKGDETKIHYQILRSLNLYSNPVMSVVNGANIYELGDYGGYESSGGTLIDLVRAGDGSLEISIENLDLTSFPKNIQDLQNPVKVNSTVDIINWVKNNLNPIFDAIENK